MRFKSYDKKGLGALGAIILVILLVAVAFVGGTAAMPYVVEQGFSVGDTFVYEWTETDGTDTITYTETNTVTAVTASTLSYTYNYSNYYGNGTLTEAIEKDGSKTWIGDWMFVDPSVLPAERSYTVLMIGFTPMIVESYIMELTGGSTLEFWVKAGTLFIVKAVWTDGTDVESAILTDTSMMWVKLI
jgi:hypothetical protein